jgi:hypothetical protein
MYTCERCGTRFGRPSAVLESCPRCLARDGVRVALAFRLFEGAGGGAPRKASGGLEAAVRERLHSTAPAAHRPAVDGLADVRDAA